MHPGMGEESLPRDIRAVGGWGAANPTSRAQAFETGGPRLQQSSGLQRRQKNMQCIC